MRRPLIVTSVLVLALAATSFAAAQQAPAAAPTPVPVPTPIPVPTVQPNTVSPVVQTIITIGTQILERNAVNARNNVRGRVAYFRRYDMQVQCGPSCYRTVRLHPGTVIDPRGGTPGVGAVVDVNGRTGPDGALEADTIAIQQ